MSDIAVGSSPDVQFIKMLLTRQDFNNNYRFVQKFIMSPGVEKLADLIKSYYKIHKAVDAIDVQKFIAWARTVDLTTPKEDVLFRELVLEQADKAVLDDNVTQRLTDLTIAGNLEALVDDIRLGKTPPSGDEIAKRLDQIRSELSSVPKTEDDKKIQIDTDKILENLLVGDGLEWRLESLNLSVGPVHPTDVILITKQPETGGTSFLISEFTHMCSQLKDGQKAIIFHNEEGSDKVASRIVQSALNVSTIDWINDPVTVKNRWKQWSENNEIVLYSDADMSTEKIEEVLNTDDYVLVGINVIEKIGLSASSKMEEVERLAGLGRWLRHIASQNRSVFAITQAGASADDKRWLTQADVYGSKTKLPAESDIMIGIGRDQMPLPGQEDYRYIKVIRNKKPISHRMDPRLKYGAFVTELDIMTGRYTDVQQTP